MLLFEEICSRPTILKLESMELPGGPWIDFRVSGDLEGGKKLQFYFITSHKNLALQWIMNIDIKVIYGL